MRCTSAPLLTLRERLYYAVLCISTVRLYGFILSNNLRYKAPQRQWVGWWWGVGGRHGGAHRGTGEARHPSIHPPTHLHQSVSQSGSVSQSACLSAQTDTEAARWWGLNPANSWRRSTRRSGRSAKALYKSKRGENHVLRSTGVGVGGVGRGVQRRHNTSSNEWTNGRDVR